MIEESYLWYVAAYADALGITARSTESQRAAPVREVQSTEGRDIDA